MKFVDKIKNRLICQFVIYEQKPKTINYKRIKK